MERHLLALLPEQAVKAAKVWFSSSHHVLCAAGENWPNCSVVSCSMGEKGRDTRTFADDSSVVRSDVRQ